MSTISVGYSDLFDNYRNVITNIDELMNIIENINSECQQLSSCWEGNLASAFASFSSRMDVFSKQTILNFKNTEEYKNYAINSFKLNETENINTYNV